MIARRYAAALAGTALAALWLLAAANIVVDPYAVFGTRVFAADTTPNSRYLSFDAYWRDRDRIDAVVLGASRVGCSLDIADLDRAVPGAHFARLWGEAANLDEMLAMLRAVLRDRDRRQAPLRMIMLQLDLDIIGFDQVDHSLFTRLHPTVAGTSSAEFFVEALFVLSHRLMARKIRYNLDHPGGAPANMCDSSPGLSRWRTLPIASAPRPVQFVTRRAAYARHLAALAEMAAMARARGIPFIVFTTPLHPIQASGFDRADFARVLADARRVTPLWHFEAPPWLAGDDALWSDPGHYVPAIGRLIAARMFNQPGVAVPEGFGVRLE